MWKQVTWLSKAGFTFLFCGNLIQSIPAYAQDIGLSNVDVIELRGFTAVPRYILSSFKDTIDQNMGQFVLLTKEDPTYIAFLKLSAPILVLLIIWEILNVFLGKNQLQKFFVNVVTALVMPIAYITLMSTVVFIANLFIQSLNGDVSFVDSVNKNIYYFVQSAEASKNDQSIVQSSLNNLWSLISQNNPTSSTVAAAVNPAVGQFKVVVQILSWVYFIVAILNWFSMFVVDFTLKILVFLSPIAAVSHVNGWGNGFIKKFWAAFVDCIIAKLAFHFVFFLITLTIKTQLNDNIKGVNLGFALLCICSFIALGVIVLRIRELFDFIDTSYNSIETSNNQSVGFIQNVSGGVIGVGNTAMRTISSFRNVKK